MWFQSGDTPPEFQRFIFDQLGAAPLILAILYFMALSVTAGKLHRLQKRSSELDTTKLFVMSVLLTCCTRIMGFVTIGVLNMLSISIGYDGTNTRRNLDQKFYDKCVLVLFDLPDFITLSAYTLLAVVWAESFLQSRRHWLSARSYRRSWLIAYLSFNTTLYAAQSILYILLFTSGVSSWATKTLYAVLATLNFGLPLILVFLWLYLLVFFSGFPFKTEGAARRQKRMGKVLIGWSIGRICCGIFSLTAALQYSIASSNASEKVEVYSVLVIVLLLVTELAPFSIALDDEILTILGDPPTTNAVNNAGVSNRSSLNAPGYRSSMPGHDMGGQEVREETV